MAAAVRRGLPFWLLRLESARCPSCKRDNVWRRRRPYSRLRPVPARCRWCGSFMIDWASLSRTVERFAAAMATGFAEAARATTQAFAALGQAILGTVWTVDVETATHDDLKAGKICTRISRIQVLAPDETEAKLVACQMAAHPGRMPTRATVVTPGAVGRAEEAEQDLAASVLRDPLAHAVRMRRLS